MKDVLKAKGLKMIGSVIALPIILVKDIADTVIFIISREEDEWFVNTFDEIIGIAKEGGED